MYSCGQIPAEPPTPSYLSPLVSNRISSSSVRPSRAPTGRSIATSLPSSHLKETVTLAGLDLRSGRPSGRALSNALQSRPARSLKRRIALHPPRLCPPDHAGTRGTPRPAHAERSFDSLTIGS